LFSYEKPISNIVKNHSYPFRGFATHHIRIIKMLSFPESILITYSATGNACSVPFNFSGKYFMRDLYSNIKKTKNMKMMSKLLTAFMLLFMVSCSNDTATTTVNPPISQGSWKVSLYWDTVDETANFAGYIFSFNDGGQVTATNGSTTKTGT
jgi:hypothetical protein